MRGYIKNSHTIDLIFVISIFCVFVTTALSLVIIGANVYKSSVQRIESGYSNQTGFSYIKEKIHQNDIDGKIKLDSINGYDALLIESNFSDGSYITYIYCYEGYLRELMVRKEQNISLSDGQTIIPAKSVNFNFDGEILNVLITDLNEHTETMYLYLRSRHS